jgi:hypothetical protein
MSTPNLRLRPINDLLGLNFFVPSYQRGYRWSDLQVNELMDDIWEFQQKEGKLKQEFYCLQPIVVKMKGTNRWELIDGQQRMTTIYVILQSLKDIMAAMRKQTFTLEYQTRPASASFLDNIDLEGENENIDFYHICKAYRAVQKWFEERDGMARYEFAKTLTNSDQLGLNVKIIWYEVAPLINVIDIFTRINIGKIPLNNAELIRALFLREANFTGGEPSLNLRRIQAATEWDSIEQSLQEDSFWYFIYQGKKEKYAARIEYIFDLMMEKREEDEDYYTFHKFHEELDGPDKIENCWLRVKKFYQSLKDWYEDPELYHLLGYLMATGSPVKELLNNAADKSKTTFRSYINTRISSSVRLQLADLDYHNHKDEIRSVLLLFNIITIASNKNSNIRFPFQSYKMGDWDIEHIRSVKSGRPETKNGRTEWLELVRDYFTRITPATIDVHANQSEELLLRINQLLSEGFTDLSFNTIYDDLLTHFSENDESENIDSISNLSLLDSSTNRSYKNAFFQIKRSTILHNDTEGTFVPLCTKNVFLKAYSKKPGRLLYWQQSDAADYFSAIVTRLSNYLPEQGTNSNGETN